LKQILCLVSSGEFYNKYVHLPKVTNPTPDFICNLKNFTPYFDNVIGAMDGTHINCCTSATDWQAACNWKDGVSQNSLACVSFSMQFLYFLSGWEGSVADGTM